MSSPPPSIFFLFSCPFSPSLITHFICRLEDAKKWYQGVHITGTGDISAAALEKAISILRTVKVCSFILIFFFAIYFTDIPHSVSLGC